MRVFINEKSSDFTSINEEEEFEEDVEEVPYRDSDESDFLSEREEEAKSDQLRDVNLLDPNLAVPISGLHMDRHRAL